MGNVMTAEKAALLELHTTPEELAARTQRMDRIAAEGKQNSFMGMANDGGAGNDNGPSSTTKPPKKPRSDKGKPRKQADPPVQAGALTHEQVARIKELMEAREQAIEANTKAENAMLEACHQFDAYLDSLTAKSA